MTLGGWLMAQKVNGERGKLAKPFENGAKTLIGNLFTAPNLSILLGWRRFERIFTAPAFGMALGGWLMAQKVSGERGKHANPLKNGAKTLIGNLFTAPNHSILLGWRRFQLIFTAPANGMALGSCLMEQEVLEKAEIERNASENAMKWEQSHWKYAVFEREQALKEQIPWNRAIFENEHTLVTPFYYKKLLKNTFFRVFSALFAR